MWTYGLLGEFKGQSVLIDEAPAWAVAFNHAPCHLHTVLCCVRVTKTAASTNVPRGLAWLLPGQRRWETCLQSIRSDSAFTVPRTLL